VFIFDIGLVRGEREREGGRAGVKSGTDRGGQSTHFFVWNNLLGMFYVHLWPCEVLASTHFLWRPHTSFFLNYTPQGERERWCLYVKYVNLMNSFMKWILWWWVGSELRIVVTILLLSTACFIGFNLFYSLLVGSIVFCSEFWPFTLAPGFCKSLFHVSHLYLSLLRTRSPNCIIKCSKLEEIWMLTFSNERNLEIQGKQWIKRWSPFPIVC